MANMAMKNYPALSDFKPPLGQQMSGLKKKILVSVV